ncbi:MAG: PQQ-binding-like beta-propeller repeat protein [Balneolaceae bacterium]|nr:PQQ-binding-like beta-propeller repeat protein [Balneolaceae bacterium]
MNPKILSPLSIIILLISACATGDEQPVIDLDREEYRTWHSFLGDKAATQYSSLTQINTENVHELEVAWTFSTGDLLDGERTEIQANPLIIDGVLYSTSPLKKAFALDAATGEKIWMFDPFEGEEPRSRGVNRGFATWSDDEGNRRLFYVAGHRLWAIDASTGEPVEDFGENGSLDFSTGLDRDARDIRVTATSPGIVYKDLLIHGSRVYNLAPGHIRAFNVRTGEIEWIFRTIPYPGDFGYETWPPDAWTRVGNTNSWPGMSLDEERGMVFIPVASPGHDFYGGDRLGKNLFGSSLVTLDASSGELVWYYQFVRHDIWDYDPPAAPNLVTIKRNGQMVDAVAQITKTGHVFVFNRDTGEPLFPMTEEEVPPSDLRGEEVWPTQPVPVKPEPFARQEFREEDITNISDQSHQAVLERYREIRTENRWDPPSKEGTLIFPGFDGGGEWGGAAFDPETGILYVNSNEMPWILEMVETDAVADGLSRAERIYSLNCAACHGSNRTGAQHGANPSLVDIGDRMDFNELFDVIYNGRGVMPTFNYLTDDEIELLIEFLKDPDAPEVDAAEIDMSRAPDVLYTHTGYNRWFDPEGYPAIKPPWGTLNAIDLNTGEHIWNIPLGEFEELTERGIPQTGTENYGGPVVTAGGLLFIGATKDEKFRAYHKSNGELLWETDLPAGGYATPAVYEVNGRQYVVIAAGGGKMGTKPGDTYVAFALPDQLNYSND